jgi:DNA-binding NarL/FixJ family response regulator
VSAPHHPTPPLDLAAFSVVMIEDDLLLSDLLARALRDRLKLNRLQIFSTGEHGVKHCLAKPPDLLIVDIGLPDMSGRDVIRVLRGRHPELRVIVLTGQTFPSLPGELLSLGVSGFVHKTSKFEELEQALRRVLDGGLYVCANVSPSHSRGEPGRKASPALALLTEREREIARLVASGLISKEIAARLDLSPRTVEKARAQILAKLDLRDLPGLVRWCMQHELV